MYKDCYPLFCPHCILAQTAKTQGGTPEVPAYRQHYLAVAEKNLEFREHGSQRITQKYSKDIRQNDGTYEIKN